MARGRAETDLPASFYTVSICVRLVRYTMKRPHSITVAFAALALILAGSVASAHPQGKEERGKGRDRGERVERVERSKRNISVDRAIAMAEKRFDARVVRAESREEGERVVYVLRLLNDAGRVWTVKVDAASGEMR